MSIKLHVYTKKHEKPTNAVDLTGISTQEQSGRRWNFRLAELKNRRIISVLAHFDIEGTLKNAVDMFPKTRRVVFVSGSSKADRMVADSAAAVAARWKSKLDFEYTLDLSLDDILTRAASLPEHTVIIFTQYNSDIKGHLAPAYEVEAMLIRRANAPVFGLYDFNLKNGGVGGSVINVRGLGVAAAQLSVDVKSGKVNAVQLITQKDVLGVQMFDWTQIERWGGDTSRLLTNAIVLNKRLGLWEEHTTAVAASATAFTILLVLIAGLVTVNRRRKLAEESLQESQERYRSLVDHSPTGILVLRQGEILYANPSAAMILGATAADELIGRAVNELVHPDDRQVVLDRMKTAEESGSAVAPCEAKLIKLDDTAINVQIQGTRIQYDGETAIQTSFTDITERKQAEQAMARANNDLAARKILLKQILDTASVAIFLVDMTGHITQANRRMAEMFRWSTQELEGKEYVELVDPSEQAMGRQKMLALLNSQASSVDLDRNYRRADGSQFWGHLSGKRFYDADGQELGLIGVIADITDRKHAEENLKLAASVFTHAREGITITDASGTIVEVNDTFTQITGYSREEALGQNPRILQSDRQTPEFYAAMWQDIASKGHWYGEVWNRRKNGEVYAEMLTISAVRDATGKTQNYVALFSDITSMKEHQSQLEHVAHYDALTGLPNRLLLSDRLQQAILQSHRRGQSLAVAYLDLDGFKAVNDTYGHGHGDELLVALTERMKAALCDGDTLARVGGDEFVAILVDLERVNDGDIVLQRLLKAIGDQLVVNNVVMQVSASIGVTLYPQDGGDADLLIRHADQAMYAAKQAGKNRYHLFDTAQDAAIQTRHESLEHIRTAIDNKEFVLHYQPKVNMKTGQVTGVEALIRWQHPHRGLLPPIAFLPIIEGHAISIELGEWVIATALTQMCTWKASGLEIPVSVNISARQLQQSNFASRLGVLLAAHPEIQPDCLELEVLETSALEDITHVSEVMSACQALGVRFALDDFGTGFSSLTYLRRLPAQVLKIDRSFVHDMINDPDDMAIVQGVIGLASAFHREVIAEGVETAAHGKLLLSIGCELAQGFGIARPMPAADLPIWVASWRAGAVWTA
jgi:diguanylate cyclase (GGDEF)-like protein/PAS domain S-box-containing protein